MRKRLEAGDWREGGRLAPAARERRERRAREATREATALVSEVKDDIKRVAFVM